MLGVTGHKVMAGETPATPIALALLVFQPEAEHRLQVVC
jgi:hypothetical protein